MQLVFSFSTLLASLFIVLSLAGDVNARPVKRSAGMVTLPMKRITQERSNVHPQILLQQHINRGAKRLARMTGRDAPTTLEMRDSLHKRMYILDHGPGSHKQDKRYLRQGVPSLNPAVPKVDATNEASVNSLHESDKANEFGGEGKTPAGHKGGNNAGKANPTITLKAAPASETASDVNADAPAATGAGISPIAIQAAQDGGLTVADAPTAKDSLGLDIEANDVGYIATVQMGTPPRDFKLLMDSGSSDTWVGGENCQSQAGGGCGNHTFLGPQSSSSFTDLNKPFQVTYGAGNVAGDIITDDLNFGGLSLPAHTFGVATVESVEFSSDTTTFDGLMGLAQSALSNQGVLTPVEALAKAGGIKDAITSFKLGRVSDGKNDGEVTFGGLDPAKFDAASLVTIDNVNTQGFWEGAMDSITVDGKDLGLQGRTAILDTGTTLIIAPDADAQAVHAAIPGSKSDGQGGFTIPCTTTSQIALSFSGKSFAIDPRDMLFAPVDPNDPTGDCVSGISSGQIGGAEEWLVGDVFLKNVYFSTDVTKNSISLAETT